MEISVFVVVGIYKHGIERERVVPLIKAAGTTNNNIEKYIFYKASSEYVGARGLQRDIVRTSSPLTAADR